MEYSYHKFPKILYTLKFPSGITSIQRFKENISVISKNQVIIYAPFVEKRDIGGIFNIHYECHYSIVATCPISIYHSYILSKFDGLGTYDSSNDNEIVWIIADVVSNFYVLSVRQSCIMETFQVPQVKNVQSMCEIQTEPGKVVVLTSCNIVILDLENDSNKIIKIIPTQGILLNSYLNGFLIMKNGVIDFYDMEKSFSFYSSPKEKLYSNWNSCGGISSYFVSDDRIILVKNQGKFSLIHIMNEKTLGINRCSKISFHDEWMVSVCDKDKLLIANIYDENLSIKIPLKLVKCEIDKIQSINLGYNYEKDALIIVIATNIYLLSFKIALSIFDEYNNSQQYSNDNDYIDYHSDEYFDINDEIDESIEIMNKDNDFTSKYSQLNKNTDISSMKKMNENFHASKIATQNDNRISDIDTKHETYDMSIPSNEQDQELDEQDQELNEQYQETIEQDQEIIEQYQELPEQYQEFNEQYQELSEQDQEIIEQDQEFNEQDQELNEQYQETIEQDQEIIEQYQELSEQDQEFNEQYQEFSEQDLEIIEQDQEFNEQDQEIIEQDQEIIEQDQEFNEQDQELSEQDQEFNEQYQELSEQDQEIIEQYQELSEQDQEFNEQYQEFSEQDLEIIEQDQELDEQDQEIIEQDQATIEQDQEFNEQYQELSEQDLEIIEQDQELDEQDQETIKQDQETIKQDQETKKQDQELDEQDQDFSEQDQEIIEQYQEINETNNENSSNFTENEKDSHKTNRKLTKQNRGSNRLIEPEIDLSKISNKEKLYQNSIHLHFFIDKQPKTHTQKLTPVMPIINIPKYQQQKCETYLESLGHKSLNDHTVNEYNTSMNNFMIHESDISDEEYELLNHKDNRIPNRFYTLKNYEEEEDQEEYEQYFAAKKEWLQNNPPNDCKIC